MRKPISIMAIPANEHRSDNPYNYILNTSLNSQGVKVTGYSLKRFLLANDFDILHLHWPENFLAGKTKAGACKAFAVFWLKIFYLKARGKKIVWTVHNLSAHEAKHTALMKRFYRLLYRHVDGFISLTKYAAKEIAAKGVPVTKITVVPHPHYRGYYSDSASKAEARKALELPGDKFVFLFAGQVRAYKNVTGLVDAFRQLNDDNAVLVIAGKVHADLTKDITKWIAGNDNVIVYPQFINDEDLQWFLNSADLVVTPFRQVLNSGSVFLNLSFGKPTLVSETESLRELQTQVGEAWIKTFAGALTANHLAKCKEELTNEQAEGKPDLSLFEWSRIARMTKSFYRSVLTGEVPASVQAEKEERTPALVSVIRNKTVTTP